jgi:glycosyltransferase involved in cell wall biosynthesis
MSSRIPAYIDAAIGKLAHFSNPIFHSYNYFGQNIIAKINEFKPDIIHIHWIGAGYIRPESLSQYDLPIVWTLHDLWPLCGAEHLPGSSRFKDGYLKDNRPSGESGLDLDRYVWERKMRVFKDLNITYVSPSNYVYEQANSAMAMSGHNLVYIPNGVDTKIFHNNKTNISGKLTVLFVANNPGLDINKGYSDFQKSISLLPAKLRQNIEVKIIGGGVTSESEMADIYSSATVTVVASKVETLSYVTMESMACGTPVVAYAVGGIPDLIDHKINGYLAIPTDVKDLARGIELILKSRKIAEGYSKAGRAKIIKHFSMDNIAKKYADLYRQI